MADLYEVLGVSKTATRTEIRSAYRKLSKTTHPDMPGGSVAKFALVKKSHDILSDAERRQKYDATGDESEVQPDNTIGNAMQVLQLALDKVLHHCLERHWEPTEVDLVDLMRAVIGDEINEAKKNKSMLQQVKSVDEKLAKRFLKKRKKKGHEDAVPFDVFERLLAGRLDALNRRMADLDVQVENRKKALDLCDDYIYRKDEAPREKMQSIGNFSFVNFGSL